MKYLAITILLVCATAQAQEYHRFRLPEGRRIHILNETYQAFNLEEYTTLLQMDEDLRFYMDLHLQEEAVVEHLTTATHELQQNVDIAQQEIQVLNGERQRLTDQWAQENRLRHQAEASHELDWLPWTIAAAFIVSTVVLALVVGLQ